MRRVAEAYGLFVTGLALIACVLLFLVMLLICADVLTRNMPELFGAQTLAWSIEATEASLYLITMLTAPWLLRQGQHVRVNIVLVALPPRLGWYCEWVCDVLVFVSCVTMAIYSWKALTASYTAGSLVIKTLVTPEWWLLVPLPFVFVILAVEVLFRSYRLLRGERGPRDDAVSAA